MHGLIINNSDLSWSLAILVAWFAGEIGYQITKFPRISFYVIIGFLFAKNQFGLLPELDGARISFLINIAVGLILFEFGYRINLNWLKNNPFILVTGLAESGATFLLVFLFAKAFHVSTMVSLEFASLAMSTSPVAIMYLINNQQCSGQVTERVLHLTAINTVLAIFSFKLVFSLVVFQKSGSFWQAAWSGMLLLVLSILLGALTAILLSAILRRIKAIAIDRTIILSLLIIFIVALAEATSLSAIIAALAFGLITRHRRVAMGKTQRNFGALGQLSVIVIFVAAPTTLSWQNVWLGLGMSLALILIRLVTKVVIVGVLSSLSGMSKTKGFLAGLALNPIAVFSLLLMDQNHYTGVALNQQLAPMAGIIILLEIFGPAISKFAFVKAKESLNSQA